MMRNEVLPTMSAIQTNEAISIEMQHTEPSPCLELYYHAKNITLSPKVISVSVVLGFPYADVYEMGTSFIVITNNDPVEANKLARRLKEYLEIHHSLFSRQKVGVSELSEKIKHLEKPLLLLDMGDNVGGGSPGDGTCLLSYLEGNSFVKGFICIYDPEAVFLFEDRALGDSLKLEVGRTTDKLHGKPEIVTAKLIDKINGEFLKMEPRHGGQVKFNMGKSVIVETTNNNTIVLTSQRIVPFSLQQLLAFGLDPNSFQLIVAKGVHAPLAAYMSVCKSLIRVNTLGITTADVSILALSNRRIPMFPFESIDLN